MFRGDQVTGERDCAWAGPVNRRGRLFIETKTATGRRKGHKEEDGYSGVVKSCNFLSSPFWERLLSQLTHIFGKAEETTSYP